MVTVECITDLLTPEGDSRIRELVLEEKPVGVVLNDEPVGTAMVMARDLEELAVGYLFGQGLIEPGDKIFDIEVCEQGRINVYAEVTPRPDDEMITTSGCGGTGKIARRLLHEDYPEPADFCISFHEVAELIKRTLAWSSLSQDTHCVHGCGYYSEGAFQVCYEDVGRHNAVDKLMGAILLGRFSPGGAAYTTGRLTSDMVLKCARMGIPVVLSRTAPSSLGLDIARRSGLTLGCYVRPGRVNVFNAPHRIVREGLSDKSDKSDVSDRSDRSDKSDRSDESDSYG